jgi:hypothetical protein
MEKVDVAQLESAGDFPEKSFGQEQNRGDVVLVGNNHEVRKIPIPTDDPNDPLNWPKWRKMGVLGTCCWFGECLRSSRSLEN